LLDQIDEPIASVTADGAYDTVNCYDAILKRQANVIIPPRSNAALWAENEIGKARNHAVQGCWDRGQKQWKRDIGYHRRSRIEAKMFALKRLGQGVSSRCFNRQWLKLHLATDANSGEIQAVEVTTCQYGDAEMLQPLLDQIDEPIASVTADGAYDTVNCYDAILKRQANVIIPPRSNAALWAENEIGKARNHAVQGCWDRGQKQWKRDIGYHRRSRIEAKMFALKRLGQGVSSRCFNRQVVDLQIRVDILNKFTQLGTAKTVAVA
ncbi:IS5 family transposase, partial [Acinetobacter pittii]|uniref:IS5 family transposase n=1 Tax=Acinetobacter pittii TaxID=48296 RepID=UPI0028804A69